MTGIDSQILAAQRIAAMSWVEPDDPTRSHIDLLREYLRRSALWFRAVVGDKRADEKRQMERMRRRKDPLGWNDEASDEFRTWPFLNLAARIAPEAAHIDDQARMLIRECLTRNRLHLDSYAPMICRWYVSWIGIESRGLTTRYELDAPYEPLIRLYERGGHFTTDKGDYRVDLVVTVMGRSMDDCMRYTPLIDLSDAALDALDVA